MVKRLIAIMVLGLLMVGSASYVYAQCNVDKQPKDQKVACCQCCCCKCK
jgi:hypothetical protein